jgi:hypothetical protein
LRSCERHESLASWSGRRGARPATVRTQQRAIGVMSLAAGPAARMLSPNRNATDGATCATRREVGGYWF